jgi:hypothetical protein
MKKINKKIVIIALMFLIYFAFGLYGKAQASSSWLWGGSEDGNAPGLALVGWVDMSGVSVDASGNLSGYGWSGGGDANEGGYGWIDFGGSNCTACPAPAGKYCAASCTVDGVTAAGAKKSGSSLTGLTGWARIVGIAQETANPTYGNNAGGWDGWINFKDYPMDSYGWEGELGSVNGFPNGLGWMLFIPEKKLKICQDKCDSGQSPLNNFEKSIGPGNSGKIKLRACYDSSVGCSSTNVSVDDVTNSPLLRWQGTNSPFDAVDANLIDPDYVVVGRDAAIGKSENITARYNGSSDPDENVKTTISVVCISNPAFCSEPAQANLRRNTCRGSSFKDDCGGYSCECNQADCKDCTGWKELGR